MHNFDSSENVTGSARHLLKANCSYLSLSEKVQHQCLNKLVLKAMTSHNMSPAVQERKTNVVVIKPKEEGEGRDKRRI